MYQTGRQGFLVLNWPFFNDDKATSTNVEVHTAANQSVPKPEFQSKSRFINAVHYAHVDVVKEMIDLGADVNMQDFDGNSMLNAIQMSRHLKIEKQLQVIQTINLLLNAGAKPNTLETRCGCDILWQLILNDFERSYIAKVLPNLFDKGFYVAQNHGKRDIVITLLSDKRGDHYTPKLIQMLLELGGNINTSETRLEYVHGYSSIPNNPYLEALLIRYGVKPEILRMSKVESIIQWTPYLLKLNAANRISDIINLMDDEDYEEASRRRLLHKLLGYGGKYSIEEPIDLLIKGGVDPNSYDYNGHNAITALLKLANGLEKNGNLDFGSLTKNYTALIKNGADPEAKNEDGSPNIFHIKNAPVKVFRYLLRNGLDPTAVDSNGNSILNFIVELSPEVVKVLIEFGANPNSSNNENIKPLDYADQLSENVLAVLIDNGAMIPSRFDSKQIFFEHMRILKQRRLYIIEVMTNTHPTNAARLYARNTKYSLDQGRPFCVLSDDGLGIGLVGDVSTFENESGAGILFVTRIQSIKGIDFNSKHRSWAVGSPGVCGNRFSIPNIKTGKLSDLPEGLRKTLIKKTDTLIGEMISSSSATNTRLESYYQARISKQRTFNLEGSYKQYNLTDLSRIYSVTMILRDNLELMLLETEEIPGIRQIGEIQYTIFINEDGEQRILEENVGSFKWFNDTVLGDSIRGGDLISVFYSNDLEKVLFLTNTWGYEHYTTHLKMLSDDKLETMQSFGEGL